MWMYITMPARKMSQIICRCGKSRTKYRLSPFLVITPLLSKPGQLHPERLLCPFVQSLIHEGPSSPWPAVRAWWEAEVSQKTHIGGKGGKKVGEQKGATVRVSVLHLPVTSHPLLCFLPPPLLPTFPRSRPVSQELPSPGTYSGLPA